MMCCWVHYCKLQVCVILYDIELYSAFSHVVTELVRRVIYRGHMFSSLAEISLTGTFVIVLERKVGVGGLIWSIVWQKHIAYQIDAEHIG